MRSKTSLGLVALIAVAVFLLPKHSDSAEAENGVGSELEKPELAEHLLLHATFKESATHETKMIIEELSYQLVHEQSVGSMVMLKVKGRKRDPLNGTYSENPELMFIPPDTEFELQVYDKRTQTVHRANRYSSM